MSKREESSPKLILDVHKDAAMDVIKKPLGVDSGPPPQEERGQERPEKEPAGDTAI